MGYWGYESCTTSSRVSHVSFHFHHLLTPFFVPLTLSPFVFGGWWTEGQEEVYGPSRKWSYQEITKRGWRMLMPSLEWLGWKRRLGRRDRAELGRCWDDSLRNHWYEHLFMYQYELRPPAFACSLTSAECFMNCIVWQRTSEENNWTETPLDKPSQSSISTCNQLPHPASPWTSPIHAIHTRDIAQRPSASLACPESPHPMRSL